MEQAHSKNLDEQNTFLLHIDSVGYCDKPNGIQNQIRKRTQSKPANRVTINQLIKAITNGQTVSLGVMKGGLKSINWKCQQVFFVDIDNDNPNYKEMTVADALEICKKYNIGPTFSYYTYNNSKEKTKFRICFILDKPIYSSSQRSLIMKTLNSIFVQADKSCKDATRLHYGTNNKEIPYRDDNARITFEEILLLSEKLDLLTVKNNFEKNIAQNDDELINLVANYDFETYIKHNNNSKYIDYGNYILFENCPICGHKNCFVYYKNNKMFNCFGANGGQAGNILNFISITEHLTMKDAVNKFKYEILGLEKPKKLNGSNSIRINKNTDIKYLYNKLKSLKQKPYHYKSDDIGMSTLFADAVNDILRFNYDRNCWMYFNSKKWINDSANCKVNQYGKYFKEALLLYTFDDEIYSEYEENQRAEYIENFRRYINSYGSKRKRDIMIKDAESVYPVSNKDFDKNSHLFNLQNGTLNLITGELQKHNPADLISKIANASYNKKADAVKFKKFLNEIMRDNHGKIHFILKIISLCLTAETKEEKFFIFYGSTTRNGKSTLLETILNVLGEYALSINPETLSVKRFSDSRSANGDIARLDGARLVIASEPPENMILNVSDIKTLTGADTITARNPYERHFQFKPVFKLIMNTNHLPKVNDNTLFMSNRVYVVTFDRHFSEKEQDKNLKYKLSEDDEISGILNLLIEALNDYRQNGLNPPIEVLNATSEYAGNSDTIKNFVKDCFEISEKGTMDFRTAYSAYKLWVDFYHLPIEAYHDFTRKIRQNVTVCTKNGNRNTIIGYTIRQGWSQ